MPALDTLTANAETVADASDALRSDREAQFLEVLGEIPEENADVAEPVEEIVPEGEPVAEPEAPAGEPEAVGEEPVADADPLKDAKPFEYTVDGQAKTYDGIKVIAGPDGAVQGAVIQPEAFKDVQYRLQRGEYLEGQNKALYEKAREYDAVTYKDRATGTEHRGMAAIEQYALENARQDAALRVLVDVIENPDKLIALATSVAGGDNTPLNALTERLAIIAENATYKTRAEFSSRISQVKQQETETQDRSQVTTNAITNAVDLWAKQFPALTAEDKQEAVAYFTQLGNYVVRPATPEEAAKANANLQPGQQPVQAGQLIIDHPVVHGYLAKYAKLREQAAASTTAASQAARENAARLAGAARPTKARPTPRTPAAPPAREKSKAELWQEQREQMVSGRYATDTE